MMNYMNCPKITICSKRIATFVGTDEIIFSMLLTLHRCFTLSRTCLAIGPALATLLLKTMKQFWKTSCIWDPQKITSTKADHFRRESVLGFEVPDFPNIQPLKLFSHSVHTLQMETSRTVQGRPPGIEWFPSGSWNPLKNDLRVSPSPSPSHDIHPGLDWVMCEEIAREPKIKSVHSRNQLAGHNTIDPRFFRVKKKLML